MNPTVPKKVKGTVQRMGLEGGLWCLVTDDGTQYELVDPPQELLRNGLRAEVEGSISSGEVSIGMVGESLQVHQFSVLA